jgi:hypothetical protein
LRRISSREVAMAKAYSCAKRSGTCPLTVKLRGRAAAPDERRGRTLSTCARGAKPLTPHGPLQRLLEDPEEFREIEHQLTMAFRQVQTKLRY